MDGDPHLGGGGGELVLTLDVFDGGGGAGVGGMKPCPLGI